MSLRGEPMCSSNAFRRPRPQMLWQPPGETCSQSLSTRSVVDFAVPASRTSLALPEKLRVHVSSADEPEPYAGQRHERSIEEERRRPREHIQSCDHGDDEVAG